MLRLMCIYACRIHSHVYIEYCDDVYYIYIYRSPSALTDTVNSHACQNLHKSSVTAGDLIEWCLYAQYTRNNTGLLNLTDTN